jgi:hypothetical protein
MGSTGRRNAGFSWTRAVCVGLLLAAATLQAEVAADTGQLTCQDAVAQTGTVSPATPDPEAAGFDAQDCTQGSAAAQALGVAFATDIAVMGGDWSKIGAAGQVLAADAGSWVCVRDNRRGLMWEVKTVDGGLRDVGHAYAWRDTDSSRNGGNSGSVGTDTCAGTLPDGQCNTAAYIAAVNAAGLCGGSDWRLPSIAELETLVDFSTGTPAVAAGLFPNTFAGFYWSATNRADNANGAWGIVFDDGRRDPASKGSSGARVRLVREVAP